MLAGVVLRGSALSQAVPNAVQVRVKCTSSDFYDLILLFLFVNRDRGSIAPGFRHCLCMIASVDISVSLSLTVGKMQKPYGSSIVPRHFARAWLMQKQCINSAEC